MPHTINLVSQFEDVIRRGGNELESSITNVVRGGWVRKSGARNKITGHNWFQHEEYESPPPIPKRAPVALDSVPYTILAHQAPRDRIKRSYLDARQISHDNEDKANIFAFPDDGQVFHIERVTNIPVKGLITYAC